MGTWVATTHTPTPLGVIFHNTELNHLGYALDRESVPLCKHGYSNETEEIDCFRRNNFLFIWDRRDFVVRPDIITRFVSSFLFHNSTTNCDEMQKHATENDFVLYNAYCSHGGGVENEFSTEHYYRKTGG